MKIKTLSCFNTFLKWLLSLSVLLSSFSAYSHKVWDDEFTPIKIKVDKRGQMVNGAYIWKEPGAFYGWNYYLHFHFNSYHSSQTNFEYEITEEIYNELRKKPWERDFDLSKFMLDESESLFDAGSIGWIAFWIFIAFL